MRTRWVPGYLTSFWVFWERFGDKELSKFWLQEEREKGKSSMAVTVRREGSDFFRAWHFPAYGGGYAAIRGRVGAGSTLSVAVANFHFFYGPLLPPPSKAGSINDSLQCCAGANVLGYGHQAKC